MSLSTIFLRRLRIVNFKGIKELDIRFGHMTDITGANGTGKTTVADAFRWLFFDKDSSDRTDFNVQPLDKNNRIVPKVEVEVLAELDVDGEAVAFKRTMKENYVQKRGSNTRVKDGNENIYCWNDVPMRKTDYQVKVNGVISEETFKLLTNPHYFNTIKWTARRQILMDIAGAIDNNVIAAANPKFSQLLREMKGKTEKEFKDQIAATKKKIKEQLEQIPHRIDEAKRSIPAEENWVQLLTELGEKEAQLSQVDNSLLSESTAINASNTALRESQTKLHGLRTRANAIEFDVRQAVQNKKQEREAVVMAKKRELRGHNDELSSNTSELLNAARKLELLTTEQTNLRAQWEITNAKSFDFDETELNQLRADWKAEDSSEFPGIAEEDCSCPTCKRAFDAEDLDVKRVEFKTNFDNKKAVKLAEITAKAAAITTGKANKEQQFLNNKAQTLKVCEDRGVEITSEIAALKAKQENLTASINGQKISINTVSQVIADLEKDNATLNTAEAGQVAADLQVHTEYQTIQSQIKVLEGDSKAPDVSEVMSQLKQQKTLLVADIDAVKSRLAKKQQIKAGNTRVSELEKEESVLANQLAEQEGIEFTMQQFTKARIEELESRINGMFKYARFKMYDLQINGGESECCETTYNGVPFSDLNTASKMKVGIDIINTLSKHYEVVAPIFLDNRESVTEIPDTDAQVINLKVNELMSVLTIRAHEEAVA